MQASKATLFHANASLELGAVQLSQSKATFVAPRDVASRFVRLTFKIGDQWFDVEGVAISRASDGPCCRCEMGFAALPASTMRRLEAALKAGPPRRPVALPRPKVRRTTKTQRIVTPLPGAA